MAVIKLGNKGFWEWMCYRSDSRACYAKYIEDIAAMMNPHMSEHVAYAYHQGNQNSSRLLAEPSTFLRGLWESVPIWY